MSETFATRLALGESQRTAKLSSESPAAKASLGVDAKCTQSAATRWRCVFGRLDLTYTNGAAIAIGPTHATAINVGNSGSTTTIVGVIKAGAGGFTANGTGSGSITSVLPSGAHSTVQEWLTITDASGNVRYVPAF